LNHAARYGHEGVARLLLEHGADVETKDNRGGSPLIWAAEWGHAGVVRLLLENGAEAEAKDMYGRSPLHLAAQYPALLALFASPALRRLNILARRRRLPALPNEIGADADAAAAYAAQCLHVTERDVERIFLQLSDARDVAQLRLVCKTWRRLADSESVLAERPESFFERVSE
jgi:ankyrin repeat protein